MSGGIAYVYDVQGKFAAMCNKEMVELDPLDEHDAAELQAMVQKHFDYTGSTVAQFVLKDFENQLQHFVKVFPTDYKRVLMQKKQSVEVSK
jgi:glutamate synthase (NADPH/NADH) large chain